MRTLRFYADVGVVPEAGRTESGYRLFRPDAVARARLVRTLRALGVGDDIKRLSANASLDDIAAAHARALDAQIRTLRLQRAVLGAVARSTEPQQLERITDLATLTAEERRRILDDYVDAVFSDDESAVADKLHMGAPELPEDPTANQVAAWVELAALLRDPDYIAISRRMAERAVAEGPEPDTAQFEVAKAVGEHADAGARAGLDHGSPEGAEVVERIEATTPGDPRDHEKAAERIEAFSDRRVARYWTSSASSTVGPGPRRPRRTRSSTPGTGTPERCARTRRRQCRRLQNDNCQQRVPLTDPPAGHELGTRPRVGTGRSSSGVALWRPPWTAAVRLGPSDCSYRTCSSPA